MQVDRAVTGLFRMEIDFPELTQGVGLDEMPFVVNVEAMVDGMALHVGHEARDVDHCHEATLPFDG